MLKEVDVIRKVFSRAAAVCLAIRGQYDGDFKAAEVFREKESALRRALDIETRQSKFWQSQFFSASGSHAHAQQIMAQEIDSLIGLATAMARENEDLRRKCGEESGMNWAARLAKYKEGDYMALVERYKESFVNFSAPEGIRVDRPE